VGEAGPIIMINMNASQYRSWYELFILLQKLHVSFNLFYDLQIDVHGSVKKERFRVSLKKP
jgi:hypothetical protein